MAALGAVGTPWALPYRAGALVAPRIPIVIINVIVAQYGQAGGGISIF